MDQGRSRWIGPALALAALSGGTGCGVGVTPLDPGGDRLVIASDLTAVECRALEVLGGAGPARWVRLRTGESVARLAEAGADVDVVIVATADAARRLEDRGVIEPGSTRAIARPPAGLAIQRSAIVARALPEPNGLADLDRPEYQGVIAWADPAIDAAARAISRRSLGDEDGWRVGYARLVRLAGRSRPVAPGPSRVLGRLEHGDAAVGPSFEPAAAAAGLGFMEIGPTRDAIAGVSRGSPRAERARTWLARVGRVAEPDREARPGEALETALLGAILTAAHPELSRASEALAALPEGGRRVELEAYCVEPPPWPPSSVRRLRERDPEGALLDELAGQVATGLEARTWLLQSWERPERPLDGLFLDELGRAADGLLAADPRFQAWLTAEWTAWARQRFRRVTREAQRTRSESRP